MSGQATLTSERIAQDKLNTPASLRTAAAISAIEQKAADLKNAITELQATTGTTTTAADTVINALKAQL